MPLVKCPDCNAEHSSEAAACPRCGRPITPKKFGRRFWIVAIIAALVMTFLVINAQSKHREQAVKAQIESERQYDEAIRKASGY